MKAKQLKKAFELERKKFKEIEDTYYSNMIDSFIELIKDVLTIPACTESKKTGIAEITEIGLVPQKAFVALKVSFILKIEDNKFICRTLEIEPKLKHIIYNTNKESMLQNNMYDKFISLFSDYISQESINVNQNLYKRVMENQKANPQYEFLIKKECLEDTIRTSMGDKWYSEYEKKKLETSACSSKSHYKNTKVKI